MSSLVERHGGMAVSAPSMQEVALGDQTEAFALGEQLIEGRLDVLILLTGVGARTWFSVLETRWPADAVDRALRSTELVCRGPKPVAVLKARNIKPRLIAEEPNTWREVLALLDGQLSPRDRAVGLQEYGAANEELRAGLRARGAKLTTAAIYAWRLPDNIEPLRRGIGAALTDEVDAVTFTSAQQIEHVLQVAARDGVCDELIRRMNERLVVASIGPVTTEALTRRGVQVDVTPEHPKMGHLIRALFSNAEAVLARKGDRAGQR